MKAFLVLIFLSQYCLAAELSYTLSKIEMEKLSKVYSSEKLSEKFPGLLDKLGLKLVCKLDEKLSKISFEGSEEDLQIVDFIYLSWIHEFKDASLNFRSYKGSLAKEDLKSEFTRKLSINDKNKFQFSDKLIEGEKQNINGFSFDVIPIKSLTEEAIAFDIRLTYKDQKPAGNGSQFLDLNTRIAAFSGKKYVFQLTNDTEAGWDKKSFLTFQLDHDLGSKYFKNNIPKSVNVNKGVLKFFRVSKEIIRIMKHDPKSYFRKLGINFTDWSFVYLNENFNEILMYNSKENFDLLYRTSIFANTSVRPNVQTFISIYESNLIINDTDDLKGHQLKKLTSFTTICSEAQDFLLSKRFDGEYESSIYVNARMPYMNNTFLYELTLKLPGPKSKAKNFKVEGNFGKKKKYRVHLDDYHFMEIQVIK